jgi:hypothetical protein
MDVEFHNHDGLNTPKILQTHVRGVYAETDVVTLTGDQTVAGVKTFSSIPVLPASNPTTDNQAVRKAYVDSLISGYEVVPGSTVRDSAIADINEDLGGTYVKVKEIEFNEVDGIITTYIDLEPVSGTVYGRVYVNGSAVGTERSVVARTQYSENIAVETGDLVQLYAKGDVLRAALQLKYDKVFTVTPGTVNDD